jgi:dolichol-phosphate mannosyltransferase
MTTSKLLSIIVPTYNEEYGIHEFYKRTKAVLNSIAPEFTHEIIFVNDFSTDQTLSKLKELALLDKQVKIIHFSRNFGNQIAITAGIDAAKGDLAVIIDDDLQDPPELITAFIDKWLAGYKVVYGVRPNRKGVNTFFKYAAKLYYRLIGNLSETKIPKDTGDFRLIDKAVMDVLRNMREESRYYRGMVSWVGFKQIGIEYDRDSRYAGTSTFSPIKYFRFAINGLTSFTDRPLYFSSALGIVITLLSFMFLFALVAKKIINPNFSIPGWPSLITLALFFGGVQLLSIGIVSIYISKIYREVKGRPLYIIEETQNLN